MTVALGAHSSGDSVTENYVVPDNHYYDDVYNAYRCALEGETCECDGKVVYAKMTEGPGITVTDLEAISGTTSLNTVGQSIECSQVSFGSDPAPGEAK